MLRGFRKRKIVPFDVCRSSRGWSGLRDEGRNVEGTWYEGRQGRWLVGAGLWGGSGAVEWRRWERSSPRSVTSNVSVTDRSFQSWNRTRRSRGAWALAYSGRLRSTFRAVLSLRCPGRVGVRLAAAEGRASRRRTKDPCL